MVRYLQDGEFNTHFKWGDEAWLTVWPEQHPARVELSDIARVFPSEVRDGRPKLLKTGHTQRVPNEELDPAVRRSIRILIASEVFGVEVFARAERHGRTPAERHLWAALHELETQTRTAVFERLSAEVSEFRATRQLARTVGYASGNAMPLLPKRLQLRSVVLGAKPFMPHFKRLDAHFAGTPEGPFFKYVLAHEYAILELGARALARDDNATAPVEALLGQVPV